MFELENGLNRGSTRARLVAALAALCFLGIGTGAGAQTKTSASDAAPTEITGTVLALEEEGEELILDLGSTQGATEGATVEIWRPLKLKHPVTGKVISDRFRIGTLELGQVRPSMSIATATGTLTRTPEKGDLVILRKAPAPGKPEPTKPDASTTTEAKEMPAGDADPEAIVIATMFDKLKGADLVTRIKAYEDYVREKPNGRYARVLYEEAASLRRLIEADGKPGSKAAPAKGQTTRTEPSLVSFSRPTAAVEGTPLELAVELDDLATGAILHVRTKGKQTYTPFVMTSAGPGYWAATVPGDRLVPEEIEYFIEATMASGAAKAVVGLPSAPERIQIQDAPKIAKPEKRIASAVLLTDFADYNGLKGNDRVWQTEGTFGLRYGDTGVRALRTGFGVYRGVGGSLNDLDTLGLSGRPVGLTYGYLETEVGFHRLFGVIGRMAIGLLDDGISGGGQILFRIGNDRETNLVLGGELLGGVGLRGFTQLELNTFKRVPILVRTEVTNQPAGSSSYRSPTENGEPTQSQEEGEVGARGIIQVGYRLTPGFVVAARVSFQGRTINHAGPGFGGAVGYEW
ncbi:hypothetical protein KEG38_21045 [Polyangium jinanense]|uniref:hypothetical protein n=1 Tax=Polyangium jinanense TaxID=2829994 RepID=UPI002341F041|nr:hypothetical protein [Polyangium jinanense]MDC3952216.1 hypothetical protein [Polyangium jinanense]MDC3956361.1 hypothetical protein [Polyangium jinanense]